MDRGFHRPRGTWDSSKHLPQNRQDHVHIMSSWGEAMDATEIAAQRSGAGSRLDLPPCQGVDRRAHLRLQSLDLPTSNRKGLTRIHP